ncbi:MAG TPA: hypothetical protein VMS40_20010 [Vicinamibacterales bacterium]|nr:hypothetical protein [Vicinamibacterales bacterium]
MSVTPLPARRSSPRAAAAASSFRVRAGGLGVAKHVMEGQIVMTFRRLE